MRADNNIFNGAIGEPLNAPGLGKTMNAYCEQVKLHAIEELLNLYLAMNRKDLLLQCQG
jgi:hypothetical protein